jgi:hypothetical protein
MGRVVVKRLKVLMSAYACAPGKGSEPGVGWAVAREMACYHDIWVITRRNNRPAIEAELARNPQPGLCFVYWDLPNWARFWKRGRRGASLLLPLAVTHPRYRPRPASRSGVRFGPSRNLRPVLGSELLVLPGSTSRLGAGRRRRIGAEELLAGRRVVECAV